MKRLLCLLFVLIVSVAALGGCGIEEAETKPADIVEATEVIEEEPEVEIKYVQIEEILIRVDADPEKGFHWPYYLSIPNLRVPEGQPIYLLVNSNNTPIANDDFKVHDDAALEQASKGGWFYSIAKGIETPLLVPVFPRPVNPTTTPYLQMLTRDALLIERGSLKRVDLQLIAMIEDAQARLEKMNLITYEKVLINGYSSSGGFAIRFVMLHPYIVRAVAAGGVNSMPILPIVEIERETLSYPVGIGDLEKLIGKAFNLEGYLEVDQFIYMGAEDNKEDLAQYSGLYSREQAEQIWRLIGRDLDVRWENSQRIYIEQGAQVRFKTYDGIGHIITPQIDKDVIAFFKKIINEEALHQTKP